MMEFNNYTMSFRMFIVIFVSVVLGNVSLAKLVSTSISEESTPNLKAVAVLFRHGDRSPAKLYPNDPYKNCSWFGGLGALSEIGALMHYNNGARLRRRYRRLIPKNELYSTERMYVVSSPIERCLMSAQSFLAGFFPPPNNPQLLPIRWQPIVINSLPLNLDYMLAQSKSCPKYDLNLKEIFDSNNSYIRKVLTRNNKYLAELTKKTGEKIKSLWDVVYLADTLQIQIDAQLEIPKWAKDLNKYVLKPLENLAFERYAQAYVVKRVKGGALLNDMMERINNFVNKESTVNINIYSAHDTTVATLLSVLEITNQTAMRPEYAATVAIELHKNRSLKNDYEVKIVYFKNTNIVEPIVCEIPGCRAPCALRNFNALIEPKLTKDYDGMCKS